MVVLVRYPSPIVPFHHTNTVPLYHTNNVSHHSYTGNTTNCPPRVDNITSMFNSKLCGHCSINSEFQTTRVLTKLSTSHLSRLAPLEAILFDVDGTLCDSDPIHYQAYREMLPEIGFNGGVPITEEFYAEFISGKHNEDMATFFFPRDHQQGIKFTAEKEAMFRRLAKDKLKPVSGLYKLKKWVEDRGLKRAAVTNAPRENAELMISALGLSEFFEYVVLGNECEHGKPHPDPYLKALELLNVSKDHSFVFEDSVSGIKAGVAAGMPVVGLTTGNLEHLLMEAKPAFLIKDFEDPKLWAALEELDRKAGVATTEG